jgi:signal transduction histidine kinase
MAWAWCALTLALSAAATALAVAAGMPLTTLAHLLFVVACAVAGGLIGAHRPGHMVGRLLALSAFCFALMEACGQYAILGLRAPGLPLATAAAWPQTWLWVPANMALTLIPAFFPSGRLATARLRPPIRAAVAVAALTAAVGALRPGVNQQVGLGAGPPNPLGVAALAGPAAVTEAVLTALLPAVFLLGAADLAVRARRSRGAERRQVAWLVYVIGIETVVIGARLAAGLTDDHPGSIWPPATSVPWELAGALGTTLIPAAICVAVLRHGLFDIDLVINRTLVYVALSACVTGGYIAVVGYLGALFPVWDLPVNVLAAGLVALAFAPLRQRLQGWVNLLIHGERDDPYAALTRLGRRLESTADPDTALPGIARSIAEALRLPYAAVETAGGDRYAHGRAPAAEPVRLPLTHNGERVGSLAIAPRPGENGLGRRDRRVLEDLTRQVAVAVHAVRLSADLRRSRERLVMAREEERRRLRRDLHDGLGPTLAALSMRAEAAQDLVTDERARKLLAEIAGDAESALADVRTIVEGLRPPALDSLGLIGALRAAAGQPGGPRVDVHAPQDLPALPAATETAAYRIASEALANIRKHADASRATITVAIEGGTLTLEITDDGRGIGPVRRHGVGLASMRERATELGGTCVVEDRPGGGTRVRVELPAGGEGDGDDQSPGR